MPTSGFRAKCTFFFIFTISEMCAPLGMGGLGTQPFEVSETFSAPQSFELLLTQGMTLLNSGGIQLEPMDFFVDFLVLFVILSIVEEVCCNTPIIHFVGVLNHLEELSMWPCEYSMEPSWQWSDLCVI
jgi:hypothetical protein